MAVRTAERSVPVQWLADQYAAHGRLGPISPYGTGHINDTYLAAMDRPTGPRRVILQRLNDRVFPDIPALMQNIERVTRHVRARLGALAPVEADRRVLTLLPMRDGAVVGRDPEGKWWRAYLFIEGASTHDVLPGPDAAYEAARAFARFQKALADLPAPRLHETIPAFHDTPARLAALREALCADAEGRAATCRPDIEFVLQRADRVGRLIQLQQAGDLPERVTHNDTKINNVMLDDRSGEGVCVIDLDTVMPGLSLYDFGDMVRTATSPAAEDERDLSRVCLRLEVFDALARGFLSEGRDFLTPTEVELLPFSGWLITLEIGMRFLTDYLSGDRYFKVHRTGHNLDRCRTQFRLVESLEAREGELERRVQRAWSAAAG